MENENEKATDRQRKYLFNLLSNRQIDKDDVEAKLGYGISELDKNNMTKIIDILVNAKDNEEAFKKIEELKLPENTKTEPVKPEQKEPTFQKITDKVQLMARMNNIPEQLANMYFMVIDNTLYIKHAGLLVMASKKGYTRISITSEYNENTKEWNAEAKIYPKIPIEVLKAISSLSPEMQEEVLTTQYGATVGYGRASNENVKNPRMQIFLKEMAETRAVNRALRLFTGYGMTSYEEMPEAEYEVEQ
ncbi:MAG: hypothetical protein OWT28_06480 [Firmicutes bacterium]|nr:hypothetical protein [Bacillota bacterium]